MEGKDIPSGYHCRGIRTNEWD